MKLSERLFPVEKVTEKKINEDMEILKKEDIIGLDVLIDLLINRSNLEIYEESRRAYNSIKSKFYWWRKQINKMPEDCLFVLSNKNLNHINYLNFIPQKSASLINYLSFISMYELIAIRYFMTIKKELIDSDIQNVYLSRLGEQLIFGLDNFDKIHKWTKPTPEFFQKLKKIRWKNKNTKKFSNRLLHLKVNMTITDLGLPKYAHFTAIEKKFIELIAGCSAAKDNREFINKDDVVIGFKTYLKLLNTDVTKYRAVKTSESDEKIERSYLVCNKCREYYKLQPGESPDDFTNKCECGGKLEYYTDIKWLLNNKD